MKKMGLLIGAICFSFLILELFFQLADFGKGYYIPSQFFSHKSSLVLKEGFICNKNGITTFSNNVKQDCAKYVYVFKGFYNLIFCHYNRDVKGLYWSILRRKNTKLYDFSVRNKNLELVRYLESPINEEGFKSLSFASKTNKKKVLIVGDSFALGSGIPNYFNSFADMLMLDTNYRIYNTGIPGADPAQYLAVCKQYIGTLKPDVLIVNIYLGNDIFYHQRDVAQKLPIYYSTNAGNIYSFIDGKYFYNEQQAYNYVLNKFKINPMQNTFAQLCQYSSLVSYLYGRLFSHTKNFYIQVTNESTNSQIPYCIEEIESIKELASSNNTKFILSVIPSVQGERLTNLSDWNNLQLSDAHFCNDLSTDDYNRNNHHFNEKGHEKYALYLKRLIED